MKSGSSSGSPIHVGPRRSGRQLVDRVAETADPRRSHKTDAKVRRKTATTTSQVSLFKGTLDEKTFTAISGTSPAEVEESSPEVKEIS